MSRYTGWNQNQVVGLDDMLDEHVGFKTDGFFVEVGGFDCYQWSPCYPLAVLGWRGIYFEPQLDLYNDCKRRHENHPGVTIVKKAVSDFYGSATMYMGGSVSTISKEQKDKYLKIPQFRSTGLAAGNTIEVEVSTLDIELGSRAVPFGFDVLSIDVEGEELNVLDGFSIHLWRPTLVIVEAHEKFESGGLNEKAVCINEYMDGAGYDKIYCDRINNVYIRGYKWAQS